VCVCGFVFKKKRLSFLEWCFESIHASQKIVVKISYPRWDVVSAQSRRNVTKQSTVCVKSCNSSPMTTDNKSINPVVFWQTTVKTDEGVHD
jgi:hypothetical protein